MLIKNILQQTHTTYPQLGVGDIDLLLAISLQRSLDFIYKNPDKKLNLDNIRAFQKNLQRHLAGWSIASIRGHQDFFGLTFLVNRHTLIPRPDSELLVSTALDYLNTAKLKVARIIDIGTGSGCLILSIAKNYTKTADFLAVDISSPALRVARTNARKLGLKNQVKFTKSNLLKNIPPQKFDLILANLPYLTEDQLREPSIKKEPASALYGGKAGLKYYQKLLEQAPKFINKKYCLLLEIDPSQTDAIQALIKNNLSTAKIKILKDLAGHERLVQITN